MKKDLTRRPNFFLPKGALSARFLTINKYNKIKRDLSRRPNFFLGNALPCNSTIAVVYNKLLQLVTYLSRADLKGIKLPKLFNSSYKTSISK